MSLQDIIMKDIHNAIFEESGLEPHEYFIVEINPIREEGPMNKGFIFRYDVEIKIREDY